VQSYYIARAASAAHALDPTRPVGYAVAAYPAAGCQREYAPLDVLGLNEDFGWYPGPNGQIADRSTLTEYLDSIRQCYPKKAIVISEFGAEANRDGPVEERGTYAHQQDFVNYHLGVYATKPWLSGAVYWALQEFRVRPGWQGGNPRPQPPIHQKGLVTFDGRRKPAFFEAQRLFGATLQLRPAPR
jgi:beta-glucuronidase